MNNLTAPLAIIISAIIIAASIFFGLGGVYEVKPGNDGTLIKHNKITGSTSLHYCRFDRCLRSVKVE